MSPVGTVPDVRLGKALCFTSPRPLLSGHLAEQQESFKRLCQQGYTESLDLAIFDPVSKGTAKSKANRAEVQA